MADSEAPASPVAAAPETRNVRLGRTSVPFSKHSVVAAHGTPAQDQLSKARQTLSMGRPLPAAPPIDPFFLASVRNR